MTRLNPCPAPHSGEGVTCSGIGRKGDAVARKSAEACDCGGQAWTTDAIATGAKIYGQSAAIGANFDNVITAASK